MKNTEKSRMRALVLSAIFTLLLLFLSTTTELRYADAANSSVFNVTLVISNAAPTISGIDTTRTGTPVDGTTATVYILFNASDSNGNSDINIATADANVSREGEPVRNAASCQEYSDWSADNVKGVNCSINMYYYDEAGTWDINVSIKDNGDSEAKDMSADAFTYNTLHAMQINKQEINFNAEAPGTNNVSAANNPLVVNNTGNGNYSNLNLTAFYLENGEDTVGPGNFTVNTTNSALGISLEIEQELEVTLNRNQTQNFYFHMNIPSGISTGTYNSSSEWIVEAVE